MCGTTCVNEQTDNNNCGACAKVCATGTTCTAGVCTGGSTCTQDKTVYSGHITYYNLGSATVACHFPTSTLPTYYGAMNEQDYATAAVCGACVEVTNTQNNSKLNVMIADECPVAGNAQWCFNGSHHIDLNQAAYTAPNNNPAITWRYTPCATTTNIQYYFDSGANVNYFAVTIMNPRNAVSKVEVLKGGSYVAAVRQSYNVWLLPGNVGAGAGPYTLRVTDRYNNVLVDTNIAFSAGGTVTGAGQFPVCN